MPERVAAGAGRGNDGHRLRAFLGALDDAVRLVADEVTCKRWTLPSALPGMSVGGLVGHTYLAARFTRICLDEADPSAVVRLSSPGEVYVHARLPSAESYEDPTAAAVREDGERVARWGHAAVLASFRPLREGLVGRLMPVTTQRVIPIGSGMALTLPDFLDTRTTELVVHGDDLAASTGQQSRPGASAWGIAADVLLAVVRHRCGDADLTRALARPTRVDAADMLRAL